MKSLHQLSILGEHCSEALLTNCAFEFDIKNIFIQRTFSHNDKEEYIFSCSMKLWN